MERYELDAWLGDDHGLTDEQITDLLRAADDIAARYPDDDDREGALTAAYRLMVEDPEEVVDDLADKLLRARLAEAEAKAALRQVAMTIVDPNSSRGDSGISTAAGFAGRSGIDRMTIRKWIGKR